MHLVEARKTVLGVSLSFLSLANAVALPQSDGGKGNYGNTPGKYCLCLRPGDGRQDPDPTKQVCPQFQQYGAFSTAIEFGGPGGGYFGACAQIGFNFKEQFAAACIATYGAAENDGQAGAQCCSADAKHESYSCQDYPPDQPSSS
ncbi:hypothetical protein HII31_01354 [Pseudocercospora fuligena]|uniref:Uncharacterized protein n=1 Tax=Pseudocercospora fuligena TaxID=685502 RepID=A0A8H6RUT0_9PEZI|nr:hypothetical protein HII31_01354 [Pseudocercospora fuligena]